MEPENRFLGKEHHLPYLPNLHFRNSMLVFRSLSMLWFSKWVDTTHTSRVFWCCIPPHQKKEGKFRKRPVFFGKRTLLCSTKQSKTPWTSHLEDHQTPPSSPPPKVSWTIRMWIRFGGMKRGCLSWKKLRKILVVGSEIPKKNAQHVGNLVNNGIFYHINWLAGFLPSTVWAVSNTLFFLFHGNLRLTPESHMREWKGTMMLAKSPR